MKKTYFAFTCSYELLIRGAYSELFEYEQSITRIIETDRQLMTWEFLEQYFILSVTLLRVIYKLLICDLFM